jgi:hypothetical protein
MVGAVVIFSFLPIGEPQDAAPTNLPRGYYPPPGIFLKPQTQAFLLYECGIKDEIGKYALIRR